MMQYCNTPVLADFSMHLIAIICAINAGYICIMLREAEHYTRDIALSQSDSAISNILHGDVGTSRRRVPESSAIYDIL